MRLVFDELFAPEEITKKTREFYSSWLRSSNWESEFKRIFGVSYKLVLGDLDSRKALYILLKKYYRNEYFVKIAFKNQFPELDFLSECPICDRRADLISYGKGNRTNQFSCYEIKTKYDSLSRLESQVLTYAKCFSSNYVICSDDKLQSVREIVPDFVGIITYKDRSNCVFKTIRKPLFSPLLEKENMINCLSLNELKRTFKTADRNWICKNNSIESIQAAFKTAIQMHISHSKNAPDYFFNVVSNSNTNVF